MKTALYENHLSLQAKIVDFSGWEMPLQYKGILHEHQAVRHHVGLFDVSHMGRILIKGKEAETFLNYLSTNVIISKPNFSATYTPWPNEEGGCVDDVLLYKINPQDYFVIVNASNRQKDLQHLKRYSFAYDVEIQDLFQSESIIAVQGPSALDLARKIFPDALPLKPMHFQVLNYQNTPIIFSGTGYTGAGGFEIYGPHSIIVELWDKFLKEGQTYGIEPIGLGARDTLRIEKGYALYGHELSDNIAPTESVAAWTVQLNKENFLGKDKLQELEKIALKRSAYGIELLEPGIAREGCDVYKDNHLIGKVTSGTFSPSLNKSIALILIKGTYSLGTVLEVQIRQKRVQAKILKLPFL